MAGRLRRRSRLGVGPPARVRARVRLPGARLRRPGGDDRACGSGGVILCRIVADGVASGAIDGTSDGSGLDATILPGLAAELGLPSDPTGSVAARAVHAWTSLFGLINFELFGHTHNVVVDDEVFFTGSTERLAAELGMSAGPAG